MGKARSKTCTVCLGGLFPCLFLTGLVLIGLGVALYFKFPDVVTDQINKRVTVQKGHATYEQLQEPSIPIYKNFYFFNLTNTKEFADSKGRSTPNLEEIGPYSYREYRTKSLFEDPDGDVGVIHYTQQKIFEFDANNSLHGLSESDIICTINIPLVAAIDEAKDSFLLRSALRLIITTTGAKLFICQEAGALAWNYTDSLVQALHLAGKYPSKYVHLQMNNFTNDTLPSIIRNGVQNISRNGEFVQWDGLRKLTTWPNGDETGANDIRGTEGFFFRPNLREGDGLEVFVDDIQRSIDLVYLGKVEPLGINGFRYGIDNATFKSAFSEPKNARWGSWCPDGLFYLGPTQLKEIPVFGSKPHFLDGDALLLGSVMGLEPNRSEHDTVVDVEPTTGANLNFRRQLQINVQVNRTKKLPFYEIPMHETSEIVGYNGTGTLYYPVVYIDEYATMDEEFKQYLQNKGLREVQMFNTAVPAVFGIFLFMGVVCLVASLLACASFISRSRRNNDGSRTPLLPKEEGT